MSFLSILFAFLLEQAWPLAQLNPVHNSNRGWVRWVVLKFDAGKAPYGWMVWSIAVLVPALLAMAIHWVLLVYLGWAAAVVWNVAVLYVTLGFRQFSHHFTQIRDALYAGDEALARQNLAQWMRMDTFNLPRREIVRNVIEYSVLSAHRHVFGVLTWYSLLAAIGLGPSGAVVYRISEYLSRWVNRQAHPDEPPVSASLKACCLNAWYRMDWLPVRVTAMEFAFVGSFEQAVDCWRRHDAKHPADNDGVVIAATAGAVSVRLGPDDEPSDGQVPQMSHLRAVVGLVWRTVVMWMVFLALLTLARLLG